MKKAFTGIIIIAIGLIGVYWIKNVTGTNIFESYSFSKVFPFKYFSVELVETPKSGDIIIDASFNKEITIVNKWSDLWMKEQGNVSLDYDTQGVNQSRCLMVISDSQRDWAYTYRTYIKVARGEMFQIRGLIKVNGKEATSAFRITSYDDDKNVLAWHYRSSGAIYEQDQFEEIETQFTVTDDIGYIRFVVVGKGVGTFRFDDIQFKKL